MSSFANYYVIIQEMNKYIEDELLRRRGIEKTADTKTFKVAKLSDILDPKNLYELPEVGSVVIWLEI